LERGKPLRKIGKPLRKIGKPLKKSESRWRKWKPIEKAESRWRKRKAVEEDFLGFLGKQKAVEENRILCEEKRSLGEGKSQFFQEIL
jgi:hypothetical protein